MDFWDTHAQNLIAVMMVVSLKGPGERRRARAGRITMLRLKVDLSAELVTLHVVGIQKARGFVTIRCRCAKVARE